MVSYFKTQWLRIVFGVVGLVVAALCLFKPDGEFAALLWFIAGLLNFVMSYINWHHERIELLEKKQERDDQMYELVQELVAANKIDCKIMKKYEERLKKLEDRR
jgi:hypothetical protein